MRSLLTALCLLLLLSRPVAAETRPAAAAEPNPNSIWVWAGGQASISEYKSWLKIGAGYARWMAGLTWLELGATALVHVDTNIGLLGGVRWKFGGQSSVRGFVRTDLEIAFLRQASTHVAIAPRVGGGVAYYSSPGFGLGFEGGFALGPSFGDGVHLASAVDILIGADFAF